MKYPRARLHIVAPTRRFRDLPTRTLQLSLIAAAERNLHRCELYAEMIYAKLIARMIDLIAVLDVRAHLQTTKPFDVIYNLEAINHDGRLIQSVFV